MDMRARQGGWIGMIMLLLALVIVALLGRSVLAHMGLLGAHDARVTAPRAGGAGSAAVNQAVTVAPAQALERARGVEQTLERAAHDDAARIDKATQ